MPWPSSRLTEAHDPSHRLAMAESIYTQALAKAMRTQGGTQALASALRVPQTTLERWMAGTAQMPLRAFLRAIELVAQQEARAAPGEAQLSAPEQLSFSIGE